MAVDEQQHSLLDSGEANLAGRAPKQPWQRRALIGANIVVAVSLLVAGSVYGYVRYRSAQLKRIRLPGLTAEATGSGPMNILLVGSNTRTGLDPSEAKHFGTPAQVPGARSDVTMILHLEPRTGSASLLSIPRDLFVPLPTHSVAGAVGKIDSALNDGPNNLITAIQDDLGIPINHFVEINFDGFQRTINAIGGINMNFPAPLLDTPTGLNIATTGCQHLNGAVALAVVRARDLQYSVNGRWHRDPLSDLSRIRRDHAFLRIFVKTAKGQLTNPIRVNALVGGLLKQVTVDSGLSARSLLVLLRHYRHLNPDTVPETTLPITVISNYRYGNGAYGDVDMPVEPLDHQVIASWQGASPPAAAPSSTSIAVVNISGTARKAATVGASLSSLGFVVTSATTGRNPARVTETVIRYHPGSLEQAMVVLQSLRGAVMMHPDPTLGAGSVALDVGSAMVVATRSSPSGTPPTSQTAAPTTVTTVLTAGGQQPSSAADKPASYDPTAC